MAHVLELSSVAPPISKSWKAPAPSGGKISPLVERKLLPVGPAYAAHVRRNVHNLSFEEHDLHTEAERKRLDELNGVGAGPEDDLGVGEEEEPESLLTHDAKEWKKQDHYAVLGLSHLRYRATPAQIKVAHRKKVLKHHPDKKAGLAGHDSNDDNFFKCIQKAHEILTNAEKRRQFDSVDPYYEDFEDEVPTATSFKNVKNPEAEFFKKFAPVFERESRFSKKQPVNQLRGVDASKEEVEAFYDFWYNFDSWRSFEYLDKEVNEGSDSRDDKRYTEKKNKSERARRKKEDTARVRNLVDLTLGLDPRIKRIKQEEKEAREAKKKGKTGGVTPAEKKAAEEEERKKAAEAAKAKEEEESTVRAEAKKAKAAAANAAKKARRAAAAAAEAVVGKLLALLDAQTATAAAVPAEEVDSDDFSIEMVGPIRYSAENRASSIRPAKPVHPFFMNMAGAGPSTEFAVGVRAVSALRRASPKRAAPNRRGPAPSVAAEPIVPAAKTNAAYRAKAAAVPLAAEKRQSTAATRTRTPLVAHSSEESVLETTSPRPANSRGVARKAPAPVVAVVPKAASSSTTSKENVKTRQGTTTTTKAVVEDVEAPKSTKHVRKVTTAVVPAEEVEAAPVAPKKRAKRFKKKATDDETFDHLPVFSYKDYTPTPTVLYITDEEEANEMVDLLKGPLGFDMEWRFFHNGTSNKTALVQVGDNHLILLIQLAKMKFRMPEKLKALIEDPNRVKTGANIDHDGTKLIKDFGIRPAGLVELGGIAKYADPSIANVYNRRVIALQRMVARYLDKLLVKSSDRVSNWELALSKTQKDYAANDTHSALMVYNRLVQIAKEANIELDPATYITNTNSLFDIAGSGHEALANAATSAEFTMDPVFYARRTKRVYKMWHVEGKTISQIAELLRNPPLRDVTVINHVVDAISGDPTLEFDFAKLRGIIRSNWATWSQHGAWIHKLEEKIMFANETVEPTVSVI